MQHLEDRGLRVIARNWRRPEGELDVIAEHDGACVFVEVRSRTGSERGHPLETVNQRKQAQIIRTARLYLDATPGSWSAYRFDVVGVVFTSTGDVLECVHIEDAFQVGG